MEKTTIRAPDSVAKIGKCGSLNDPADGIISIRPGKKGLTYYYWDDWMLSGLFFPGGSTLTLGVAYGTGPFQLAQVDPRHHQVGVDVHLLEPDCPIDLIQGDAIEYVCNYSETYDTIWIDLYNAHELEPKIFSQQFISAVFSRLNPEGICFLHLCRPDNRFYRFARSHDLFECCFGDYLLSFGCQIWILDHYASQTWILSRKQVEFSSIPGSSEISHWIKYIQRVSRPIRNCGMGRSIDPHSLIKLFKTPISRKTLQTCGLARFRTSKEWDLFSRVPERLRRMALRSSSAIASQLLTETLTLWLTAVDLKLPPSCLRYLQSVISESRSNISPECTLRKHILFP